MKEMHDADVIIIFVSLLFFIYILSYFKDYIYDAF